MKDIAICGNAGKDVRSDCQIILELTNDGGRIIDIKSKVKTLFGNAIEKLCNEILDFFEISNCKLQLEDSGALDFVISARLEAAIKLLKNTEKNFLPPMLEENLYTTDRDKQRITRLYLPGNSPKLMLNAGIHKPDGIILDLEDSVAPDKKYEARFLVRNALRSIDFMGAELMVRINQIPAGIEDLKYIVNENVNCILIPKCESAEQIKLVEQEIKKLNPQKANQIWFMPIIESALGVEKSFEIATSSQQVVAMAIGLEDYTADIGVRRTPEGAESLYARTKLVNACKAAGIQAIDSVFSDVSDMEALRKNVEVSKSLGFEGMGCIHPRQIPVIHDSFKPTEEEIQKAQKIVDAYKEAQAKGLGVVALGSKMIDAPVVKRALKIIKFIENE